MSKSDNKKRSIERKIYFYKVVCMDGCNEIKMDSIFASYIKYLNNDYSDLEKRGIVVPYFDKYHFLDVEMHDYDKDVFKGRFYSLRSNDFPYLFNMGNGDKKEIAYTDQDTLMEQTHFYCFANQRLIVSEYNFYGARIERLGEYLSRVMLEVVPSKRYVISVSPIIIPDYFEQIIGCTSISKLQFKVAHPGLKILADEDIIGLSDIARNNLDATSDFCIDIELSGGKRGKNLPVKDHRGFLAKIVSAIKKGNEHDLKTSDGEEVAFRKAKIKAYNPDKLKTIPYDLLDEKLVYTCYVEKLSNKSKYVNSDKMYNGLIN